MKPKKKLVALYAEISDMLVEIHDRLAMIDDGARKPASSLPRRKIASPPPAKSRTASWKIARSRLH
jgi:hypothetical protein